jgi:hypothetical protein
MVRAMTAAPLATTEGHDGLDPLPAVLHVDRVDDGAAGVLLEGDLDDLGLGRVDDEGGLDVEGKLLDEEAHHLDLVGALGHRYADVEGVGALLHLLLGDVEHAVVVIGEGEALDLAGALGVEPLADDQRRGHLAELDGADHGGDVGELLGGAGGDGDVRRSAFDVRCGGFRPVR